MKVYKKLNHDYTVVSNNILNSGVSLKAMGLYLYLVSKPEGWEFSVLGTTKQIKEGKDAVQSAIQELEVARFLKRERVRNEDGTFGEGVWMISDKPMAENPPVDLTAQVSTNKVSTKNNNLKVITDKSEKTDTERVYGNTHVNRTLEEFEKLEGHEPLDRQPRQYAYNLVRRLEKLMRLNGKEPTPELVDKAISEYFRWIARKDWGLDIQKLETIFRKVPLFAAEKGLVWKEKK